MNEIEKAICVIQDDMDAYEANTKDEQIDCYIEIGLVNETDRESYRDNYKEKFEACKLAIKALEKQVNNGWIPVSERLPNNEECYKFDKNHPSRRKFLCSIKIKNYEPITRELHFSEIFGWKYGPADYNKYVIAWQELPEPYKEGENELR